ncbi:hypothetical protein N9H39_07965 [Gammaproteobacteria bacterium]|nr:hypothetical protein [Gammaproteobacteria bacterium]
MPTSKKSNTADPDGGNTDGGGTIVLSTTDSNTPAALVVDENGILDFDKRSPKRKQGSAPGQEELQDVAEDGVNRNTRPPRKPPRKPVDEILKLLRRPEQGLINGYYKSTIRSKLRERFDWYNDIEGEQNVGNTLENVYGGTYNPLRTTAHFIRNNILLSLVMIAVSGQLISNYLSTPTENRYSDTRQVVKTEESSLRATPAVADVAGARDRLHDMNHCAVSNDLRQVYENVESRTVKEDVLTEITRFITAYGQSDLENWFATRARKREVTISHIRATLPQIRRYRTRVMEEVTQLTQKYNNTSSSMGPVDLTTTSGVNQSIRLRTRLLNLETRMRYGLAIANAVPLLDEQLLRIRRIASHDLKSPPPWMSRWAVATSQQNLTSLTASIKEIIENDIHTNIERASEDTLATKLYKLRILAATLRDFGDLAVHLGETSNHAMTSVGERQNTGNGRLRQLLGYEHRQDVNFLDFDNCLNALNTADAKLTSR